MEAFSAVVISREVLTNGVGRLCVHRTKPQFVLVVSGAQKIRVFLFLMHALEVFHWLIVVNVLVLELVRHFLSLNNNRIKRFNIFTD